MLALTAGLAALCFWAIPKFAEFEKTSDFVLIYFSGSFFTVAGVAYAALNFKNIKYRFVIYTDEKGVYHYSGFVHIGFIPWESIADIVCVSKVLSLWDNSARLRIIPNNTHAFWYGMPKTKRFKFALAGARIQIKTLFTNAKAPEVYACLKESLKYYTAEQNERKEQ